MPTTEPIVLGHLSLNHAEIAGIISQYGVHTSTQDNGTEHARFTVQVEEQGFDGKVRTIYLDIDAWGKVAAALDGCTAGTPVLVEGKLARTQRGKKDAKDPVWTTTVQATRVQRLEDDTPITPKTEAQSHSLTGL